MAAALGAAYTLVERIADAVLLLTQAPAAHEARGAAAEALREFAGVAAIELCHDVAAARAALAAGGIRLAVADLRVSGALGWLAELRDGAGLPAIAMGATLPWLLRALAPGAFGVAFGALYAANTLGAVLGVVLAETSLVPRFGVLASAQKSNWSGLLRSTLQAAPRAKAHVDAAAALEAARQEYVATLQPTVGETALVGLEGQVAAHEQLGAQLVRSADARRRLLNELDIEFQSLDARVKSSLDRVWAVFGKVIGRDYLLEASRTLDELGRHLDDLGDLHGYGPATVKAIAVREKAFSALLSENETSITRVLGAEWLRETRANLDRVAWLRDLLVRTDGQRKETNDAFSQSHAELATAVRKINSQYETVRAVESARRQSAEALSAATAQERRQRTTLGWLSAIVLLLLLATIVSTVRSVVLPVRRLVRATERVARGVLFLSFHFPETGTNAVTGPVRDRVTGCPEYKVTSVDVRPL